MSAEMDRRIARPRFAHPRVLAMIAAGLVLALVATASAILLGGAKSSVRVAANGVTVDAVQDGVFHDFASLRAIVAPKDVLFLDALEGGQVEQVMAHAGDVVVAGQPLVRFRNTQLELDVLDREGRLVESITQLQAYQKQLEDARLDNDKAVIEINYNIERLGRAAGRRQDLAAAGYVSGETLDQLKDELAYDQQLRPLQAQSNARQEALRRQQIPEIGAELASLRQSLAITRGKLGALVVTAPVAGQLTSIVQNIGENHDRGERLGQIVPDTGFKLTANVDEFYLSRVRMGQIAHVDIDGAASQLHVERVYPEVKDNVFSVDLAFDGATPKGLLPGQAVDGKLTLGGDQPAVVLPAGAFLERTGGDWVMVVAADGRSAVRRRIKIGRRNSDQVEILSGLKPGERVITSDYTGFENVDRVNLTR
jgi:HlyD family secretion protein